MAYAVILNLADTVYSTKAGDGSFYTSSQLDVHANTGLFIAFTPVVNGDDTPYLMVYDVDIIGILVPVGKLTRFDQGMSCTRFGGKIQVKAFGGRPTTSSIEFALSIQGKGVA